MPKFGISYERAGVSIYPTDDQQGMTFAEAVEACQDWWCETRRDGETDFLKHWEKTSGKCDHDWQPIENPEPDQYRYCPKCDKYATKDVVKMSSQSPENPQETDQ